LRRRSPRGEEGFDGLDDDHQEARQGEQDVKLGPQKC
jgi:hypothetical protein